MNRDSKAELAKMKSLMGRMENPSQKTLTEARRDEFRAINEAVKKERKQVTRDQILDILAKQPAGQYVCITYLTAASVYKTKKNWRPDDVQGVLDSYKDKVDGNEHWYYPLSNYHSDNEAKKNPISAVIAATRYNFQWSSRETYGKGYGEYETRKSELNMKYGLTPTGKLGDYHGDAQEDGYGGWQNSKGEAKLRQNFAHAKAYKSCYLVNEDGDIIGGIPNDAVKAMSSVKSYDTTPAAAKENLSPEVLKAYQAELMDIEKDFAARDLMLDKVLCIVATVNGTPYYYINDKAIISADKKTNVNQQELVGIAQDLIGQTFEDLDDYAINNH